MNAVDITEKMEDNGRKLSIVWDHFDVLKTVIQAEVNVDIVVELSKLK